MSTTYLKAHAVLSSKTNGKFIADSELVKSDWITLPSGKYLELEGTWFKKSITDVNQNYFILKKINYSDSNTSGNDLKSKLKKICNDHFLSKGFNSIQRIEYYASDSSLGYEYPILSNEEHLALENQPFNYHAILRYALASEYVYDYKKNDDFKNIDFYQELIDNEVSKNNSCNENLHAWIVDAPANKNHDLEREVIVAFRGTNNIEHLLEDIQLTIQNFIETNKDWQEESLKILEQAISYANKNGILNSIGEPNVVVTGHSLGGFTATQSAFRLNLKSRVFSSPATKIIGSYSEFFSNSLFKTQSINFVRNKDLVVFSTGRHIENMVYFQESSKINLLANHSISNFIKEIILPNHLNQQNNSGDIINPEYIYFYPNAPLGSGLKHSLNNWGKF